MIQNDESLYKRWFKAPKDEKGVIAYPQGRNSDVEVVE